MITRKDLELFKKVTKVKNDGEVVGRRLKDLEEYKESFKELKIKFNDLVKNIAEELDLYFECKKDWQTNGCYKKFFLGKIFKEKSNKKDDVMIWIRLERDGFTEFGIGVNFSGDVEILTEDEFDEIQENMQLPNVEKFKKINSWSYSYVGEYGDKLKEENFIKVLTNLKKEYLSILRLNEQKYLNKDKI